MTLANLTLPLMRLLPAETAHTLTLAALKTGLGLPSRDPGQWDTQTHLPRAGLTLANPVGLAAGFDKNAEVAAQMARFGFGWIECGTVTPNPQPGNPKPRLFRLVDDQAVINRLGFNNAGLDVFLTNLRRQRALMGVPVGANVGANKGSTDFVADYETGLAAALPLADYLTLNISSPNTPGLRGLQTDSQLDTLLARCRSAWTAAGGGKPVFLKVAPDLSSEDIEQIIRTVEPHAGWLAGLIVSNTTIDRPQTLRSPLASEAGGLSGAPLMAKSTQVLRLFADALRDQFDLIGCGGIRNGADAYAKIRAGARAVQLYSALAYQGPNLVAAINIDLAARLQADGFRSVEEAVGADLH
ncbi:MAG: quinone-dependent dihydroorotate dehydrogenase [Henriciella sp.]|jgi:dihydroorotate dehydrogenase